ncbi:hypothetical protein AVEN_185477-1 [Araneus ventricosus]|uniref:Serum response factor-binding protein 1 n=1 Tax=Araneus ventricosus TaxID=182803 RepID=A0A4Y2HDM3_ARAVE|nr:hypothetical protein AVEN_185477-1 [Araneus ventricosus]
MDKIKVNNQVVSMRKFVKQAKIHAINKCTKQIKFLENRKGNEEQMAKTKRKLQRLLEEVKILKKIKPDSVSKLALSKAKDWKAVLAEKNVPLEERCFAMLANHPPVQESVEKFHSDNSELISKIPELVKEWEEKKSRSSQINKKKQKGQQDNAKDPNKLPIGNENNFHKSNEAEVKSQSTESLESLSDSSDLKSIQNDITEQNLKIKITTKRKESSDNMSDNLDSLSILCSPPKKKFLVVDDAKSNEFDDRLSDSSDPANHQGCQIKEELPVKDATKSDESYKNDSDYSLSDSSDIANHESKQGKEKLPVKDNMKIDQSCKNSKQSKACAVNHQTNLVEKKILLKKKTMNSSNRKGTKVESNREENSGQLQDIRSKLLEISMSKTKVQNKPRNKPLPVLHQLNAGVETDSDDEGSAGAYKKLVNSANVSGTKTKPSFPTKPEVKSKMKAITMIDLNKLQDIDEIPIEKSDSDAEDETDEDSGKQKKDPFFLCDGEPVSESDEDESAEKGIARKRDFPPFKKEPYVNFNKREQRDNLFQKRKFDKHSVNGRNSNFKEKGFTKNKELSFKDNKRNYKRTFDDNSEYRQNKKIQFASKDKFSNRNGTNSFPKNPKEKSFSQNHNRDAKGNSYAPKSDFSNCPKSIKPDDKPLHPSWEAKRKLKEAEKVIFQGKRMVFNL